MMHFQLGDQVLLRHSGEEGTVVAVWDAENLDVEVEGIVLPVHPDQLEYPYFKRFREKGTGRKSAPPVAGEQLPVEKRPSRPREERGVFLSFLPEYEPGNDEAPVRLLKLHLINETAMDYTFTFRLLLAGSLVLELPSQLPRFRHLYLTDLAFDALNDKPRLAFSFSVAGDAPGKAAEFTSVVKLRARQIVRQLEELSRLGEATFSQLLFEHYPDQAVAGTPYWDTAPPRSPVVPASSAALRLPPPVYEVDLHIEKLVEDTRGLRPSDMLAIQLGEFTRQLELATGHRQATLTVIHGVGKGTLRQEIHEILRHEPAVKSFVNQYHARYGYGATEIFFQYK